MCRGTHDGVLLFVQVGAPFPPGRQQASDGIWVVGIIKARCGYQMFQALLRQSAVTFMGDVTAHRLTALTV